MSAPRPVLVYTENRELEDVRAFHQKFGLLNFDHPGHLTRRKMKERLECLLEEVGELAAASGFALDYTLATNPHVTQDLAGQADALQDLRYFLRGTEVMLGLPSAALWDDVQRANMAKEPGMTKRGHAVDVTKPPGWEGPKTLLILRKFGYEPQDWLLTGGIGIDERKCRDDEGALDARGS